MPTPSVVQILTASIAPVIVISGIGLVLLSITNRYGRAIDRARLLMPPPRRTAASYASAGATIALLDDLRVRQHLLRNPDHPHPLRGSGFATARRFHCPALFCAVPHYAGGIDLLLDPRYLRLSRRTGDGDVERSTRFAAAGQELNFFRAPALVTP